MNLAPFPLDPIVTEDDYFLLFSESHTYWGIKLPSALLGLEFFIIVVYRYCPFSTGVIPKSVRPQHIKDNLSVYDFQLAAKDMATLNHMNTNTRFCWDLTAVTWHCRQGQCWQISLIKQEKKSAHRQCPLLLMLVPRCSPEVTWRKLSLSSRKEERYWNYKNVQFVLSIIKTGTLQ